MDKASQVQVCLSDQCYFLLPFSTRHFDRALQLMQRATAMPAKRAAYYDKSEPVQNRLYKSLKVWCMYADLEESLGTFEVTPAFTIN